MKTIVFILTFIFSLTAYAEAVELLCAGTLRDDVYKSSKPKKLRSRLIVDQGTGYLDLKNKVGSFARRHVKMSPKDCEVSNSLYNCYNDSYIRNEDGVIQKSWAITIQLDRYNLELKAKAKLSLYDDYTNKIYERQTFTFNGNCKAYTPPSI